MNDGDPSDVEQIAIGVERESNAALLADLLDAYRLVTLDGSVPPQTDLCVVDEAGFTRHEPAISTWKREQRPTHAPVLLLTRPADQFDPWKEYAAALGDLVDAIQPVPASKRALLARITAHLETRRYALDLAEERRLTERIFETSPIAKTVLDTEGNIVRANERAQDVFGLEESTITGRTFDSPDWKIIDDDGDPIPSDDLPFARVIRTGEAVYGYEHGIEGPDGERVWLSVNMAPLSNDRGDIEYLVAAIDDVTERKRLERDRRESEERHRTTLSNIHDAVFITDDEGAFTYVCPNTEYIFTWTETEVWDLGTVDALMGADVIGDREFGPGSELENVERVVTDADGTDHTVLVTVSAVDIQEGTRLYTVRDITERKRQEDRFRAFVEHSSDIVTVVDGNGVTEYVSPAVERILGYDPEDRRGETVFDVIHPEDRDHVMETFVAELQDSSSDTVGVEYRAEHADGTWRWLESRATSRSTPGGGYVINSRDVTRYRETKAELEEHTTHLEQAQEIADLGYWYLDVDANALVWSDELYRIYGVAPGTDMDYEGFLDIVHPADRAFVDETWTAALRAGEPYDVEHRILVDDEVKWVRNRAHVELEDGTPVEALGVSQDITARKERERELLELEESRSLALNAANAGIWEYDLRTGVVALHESSERLFDLDAGSFDGTLDAFLDIVHPEDRDAFERALTRVEGATSSRGVTFRVRIGDGVERWVHGRWTVLEDEVGTKTRLLGVNVDVTEQQERITQLQVLDDVLRHNLHNDMNLIRGYAEMIHEEAPPTQAEYAEHIMTWSDELLETTDKQREITQVLSTSPQRALYDLAPILDRIAERAQSRYPGVRVTVDRPDGVPVRALREVDRAISELVENATVHSDADETAVTISVTADPEVTRIAIADNGPGIPEMEQKVVTGERSLDPLYHGSGLGLWLVSWIVRRSRGTLSFESVSDEGTTVAIRLPTACGPTED